MFVFISTGHAREAWGHDGSVCGLRSYCMINKAPWIEIYTPRNINDFVFFDCLFISKMTICVLFWPSENVKF